MSDSSFLAFDLGAGSGRAILGVLQDGRIAIREVGRFANEMCAREGRLHWDVPRLFEELKSCLAACPTPRSLALDTWGVDFGLLGADGELLDLPLAYRDAHTEGAMEAFFEHVPRERIYALTGIQFMRINSLFQLFAMQRAGSTVLDRAADLLFMPDLFNYLFTGVKKTEFTFATTSQLFNPLTRNWEGELIRALELPESLFQEVVEPGTLLGEAVLGKAAGVPVVATASHDTGAAVAAVPARGKDWAYISSGTWSLVGVETGAPVISDEALRLNFTNEGGVGGTFRLLKNVTGLWLLEQCRGRLGYEALMEKAEAAPAFSGFVDPDCDAFLNPPDMRAAINQALRDTGQPEPVTTGALTRVILESLALKYRSVLEQAQQLRPGPIRTIHLIGGGARNRLLCQFTADATGIPVLAGPVEATALGNLMVQALAMGQVSSLQELREVIRRSFPLERYEPTNTRAWDEAFARFKNLEEPS